MDDDRNGRRNWALWLIGALAVMILLVLLLRGCGTDDAATTATADQAALGTPGGATSGTSAPGPYVPGSLAAYYAGGGPLPHTYELTNLTFDSGSATLAASAEDEITDVAQALKARPTARVELRGYADPAGDAAANQALSQKRAEAVRDALVKAGAKLDQIQLAGMGETGSSPIRPNRRVELTATAR